MLTKFLRLSLKRFVEPSTGFALLSVAIVLAISLLLSACSPGYLECDGLNCSIGQGRAQK